MNRDIVKVLRTEKFWKDLSYEEIMNLCETNTEFRKVCRDDATWEFLLQRDFGIPCSTSYAYKLYHDYKNVLDRLSKYYPIITGIAFYTMLNNVPFTLHVNGQGFPRVWDILEDIIKKQQNTYHENILNANEVARLISELNSKTPLNISIDDEADPYNFYLNYNDMVQNLEQNGDEAVKSLITRQTFAFVNGKPATVDYDYDLYYSLFVEADSAGIDINNSTEIINNYFSALLA